MEMPLRADAIGNEVEIVNRKQVRGIGIVSINRDAIIQYILIYLMIQYIGGRIAQALGSDVFYGGSLVFCVFLLLSYPKRLPLKKNVFGFLLILAFSLALSFAVTGGGLSIGTILSILSRFLLVYVAIQFDVDSFLYRFLKTVFFMACISLIEFTFVQVVGISNALSLFSHLYEIKGGAWWQGNTYGLFFICYNFMDATRNAYMFGEPGEYQILLITALYFMSFFEVNLENNKKIKYYIVFIITLLTTQSTTGFFNLIALMIAILTINRSRVNPFVRKIILVSIAVFILYMLFSYTEESFIYRNFFAKILSDDKTLDLTVGTGVARVAPIERFIETINRVPQKLVFGVGYDGLTSLPLGHYTTCGLINSIAMTGIISTVLLYGKMTTSILQGSKGGIQSILVGFFVINMGLSQPDLLPIMSVLMCMFSDYSGENSI